MDNNITNDVNLSPEEQRQKKFKRYISVVFAYLMLAMIISGATSLLASKWTKFMEFYVENPLLMFLLTFIPTTALAIYLFYKIKKDKDGHIAPLIIAFIAFSALIGITVAPIFLIYTKSSIFSTFFVTALIFGLAALNGITTKRDLSGWGPCLMLGLLGIMIASLVNYFLDSKPLDYLISIAGILLFTVLTAYDFQQIKKKFQQNRINEDEITQNKYALLDAINVFLDFINLFLYLLRILGQQKNMSVETNVDQKVDMTDISEKKVISMDSRNDNITTQEKPEKNFTMEFSTEKDFALVI